MICREAPGPYSMLGRFMMTYVTTRAFAVRRRASRWWKQGSKAVVVRPIGPSCGPNGLVRCWASTIIRFIGLAFLA